MICLLLHFSSGVSVERDEGLVVRSSRDGARVDLSEVAEVLAPICAVLEGGGATHDDLLALVEPSQATSAAALFAALDRFCRLRWIEWSLSDGGRRLAVFTSLASGFRPLDNETVWAGFGLSRFAYLRREAQGLVLESPETPCRAQLDDVAAQMLVTHIASPESVQGGAAEALLAVLGRFGFLEKLGQPEDQARASWTFADAVMHTASRRGRDEPLVGVNVDLRHRFPAPQTVCEHSHGVIALPKPPRRESGMGSRSLDQLMAERHSVRVWADRPLPLDMLSGFLSRVATVRQQFVVDGLQVFDKPMPSAGSIHELTWYVVAGRIDGLELALYRYHGVALDLPDAGARSGRGFLGCLSVEFRILGRAYGTCGVGKPIFG